MHDVLDPRDLVPDEAEQLRLSGYPVGDLEQRARAAAASGDRDALRDLATRLRQLERRADWPHDEPDDDESLLQRAATLDRLPTDAASLPDRIRGAWLGRAVGNTLGKPVEGLTRAELETYLRACGQWPQTGYLPLLDPLPRGVRALHPSAPFATAGRFDQAPRDDDIDWTILALHVLETHGTRFTTEQVAAAWLDRLPFTQTYTAERAAYRNLVHGLAPPDTADHDNPYREWIGALIRADAFGYVSPGDPAQAARMALVDARLSHTHNGKYGEMWAAALVASALAVDTPAQALRHADGVVPPQSRLGNALVAIQALHHEGADRTAALDWVDEALGHYPWVHTINNAALIAIGLLWGDDFIDAVGLTISGGRDTDSSAATVGSVLGAVYGPEWIPTQLAEPTHIRLRSAVRDFDRVSVDELSARTLRVAHAIAAERDAR
jgi:ADP-ribosylglycohydrolase